MMKLMRLKVVNKVAEAIQGSSMRFLDTEAVHTVPLSHSHTVCRGSFAPWLPADTHGCIVSVYCQEGVLP